MDTSNSVLSLITGQALVIRLEQTLQERFPAYQEVHTACQRALDVLRQVLGERNVDAIVDSIHRQTASNLLFAGALGLKANLDHFLDPQAPTVLALDFEVFLRESEARTLPEYQRGQETLSRLYRRLSPMERELFEPVIEYISYLETVAPKLAHFHGHLLGDTLLERLIPGYQPDGNLTAAYRNMLEAYLGIAGASS